MSQNHEKGEHEPGLVKLLVELEPDAWHGHGSETMWAEPLGGNRFRLRNVPFFVTGMSFGDIVAAREHNERLVVAGVVEHSGHSTYRVFVTDTVKKSDFPRMWARLEAIGCTYERATDRLLAIDVPGAVDVYRAYAILEEGEKHGVWDFDEGHCGHALKR